MSIPPALVDQANAAIAQHVHSWLSSAEAEAIEAEYSFAILLLVEQIHNFAVNQPVNWSEEALETAMVRVGQALRTTYPQLTTESIYRLQQCFAYQWK